MSEKGGHYKTLTREIQANVKRVSKLVHRTQEIMSATGARFDMEVLAVAHLRSAEASLGEAEDCTQHAANLYNAGISPGQ